GGEVKFNILPHLVFFFVERGGGQFWPLQYIDALRTNGRQQIVEVFGRVHIVRDKVVDLVIGQISLLLPCIDQLFNVVVLFIKSQTGCSSSSSLEADAGNFLNKRWERAMASWTPHKPFDCSRNKR